jgi:hypothetical protein
MDREDLARQLTMLSRRQTMDLHIYKVEENRHYDNQARRMHTMRTRLIEMEKLNALLAEQEITNEA